MNREVIFAVARDRRVQLGATSVLSAALGAAGAYYGTKAKLRKHYEQITKEEIAEAKVFYARLNKKDLDGLTISPEHIRAENIGVMDTSITISPNQMGGEFGDRALAALRTYSGDAETPVETEEELIVEETSEKATDDVIEVVQRNVFAKLNEDGEPEMEVEGWNYKTELAKRAGYPAGRPYIISEEEYLTNEKEYEQTSLTYFNADDVLSDDKDIPLPDPDATVGEGNLTQFGHGSGNKNLLYICNDELELLFEIMRSPGSYAAEVHDFREEDYDTSSGIRRFRKNDE